MHVNVWTTIPCREYICGISTAASCGGLSTIRNSPLFHSTHCWGHRRNTHTLNLALFDSPVQMDTFLCIVAIFIHLYFILYMHRAQLGLNPLENDPVLLYLYFAGLSCRKDRCGTRSNLFFSILSVNTLLLCLSVVLTIRGRVLLLKKTLDEDAKVHLPWTEVCGCQRGAFDVGRTVAVWLDLWICIKA